MLKKQNEIPELPNLNPENVANLFRVGVDENGDYYYDLSDTLYLDMSNIGNESYNEYVVSSKDSAYSISNKFYGTPKLWWLVLTANDITDPFTIPSLVGERIKIIKKSLIGKILTIIDNS